MFQLPLGFVVRDLTEQTTGPLLGGRVREPGRRPRASGLHPPELWFEKQHVALHVATKLGRDTIALGLRDLWFVDRGALDVLSDKLAVFDFAADVPTGSWEPCGGTCLGVMIGIDDEASDWPEGLESLGLRLSTVQGVGGVLAAPELAEAVAVLWNRALWVGREGFVPSERRDERHEDRFSCLYDEVLWLPVALYRYRSAGESESLPEV